MRRCWRVSLEVELNGAWCLVRVPMPVAAPRLLRLAPFAQAVQYADILVVGQAICKVVLCHGGSWGGMGGAGGVMGAHEQRKDDVCCQKGQVTRRYFKQSLAVLSIRGEMRADST